MNPINYNKATFKQRKEIREKYVLYQGGKCWYCKSNIYEVPIEDVRNAYVNKGLFPKGFFSWPIHLHHDHNTGLTIGAVHNRCNAILWQYFGE